ncbi:hypothetical protein Hanom_Chr14g01307091 [Helianthus anomalus]
MVNWTEEEIALVALIVDAQHTLQRGQTAYWGQAFQHVSNNRNNLNACQHKLHELIPKLDLL